MTHAYHALELFEIPQQEAIDATRRFLSDASFEVSLSSPSDARIRAECGSHFGVTDQQTSRVMEIIFRASGKLTAVSVYHHTANIGPLVGTTFGSLLSDETNALLRSLAEIGPTKC